MLTATPSNSVPAQSPVLNAICRGTPWEAGYQQGEALREKIHQLRNRLVELEAFRLQQPWWLPYRGYLALAEWKAGRYLARALTGCGHLAERLAGLAAGAKADLRTVSLFHAMEPILSAVDPNSAQAVAAACSAVAVGSSHSSTGKPMLVRNFDYLPMIQPFYILRQDQPRGGLRSLAFTAAPMIGAVDGMNESGLCITYNYAYVMDASPPAPTISMRIMEALSQCRTVREAAKWISEKPRWGAGLLMLADETGEIAALELTHTKSQLRLPANNEGILYHSNCCQAPETQSVQAPHSARWGDRAPRDLRGKRVLASGENRDRRFQELLSQHRLWSVDDLTRLMADHGSQDVPGYDTICVHSDYWNTTASLQFFPATRKMRVSYSSVCTAQYQEFHL